MTCNKDCENCQYKDCILDGLGRAPKDKKTQSQNYNAIRMRAWYEKNKEAKKAKSNAYYWEHREGINARRRKKTKEAADDQ